MNSLDVGFISEFEILSSDQRRCKELHFTSQHKLGREGEGLIYLIRLLTLSTVKVRYLTLLISTNTPNHD